MNVWPQNWARPTWMPSNEGPPLPIPADPSGSPYQQAPRGLYVPSGPAPDSKLGLPLPPPPLPFGTESEEGPQPESLPPNADDLDVSFQNQPGRRPAVVPAPPVAQRHDEVPRVATRTDAFDRFRQPVRLETPEVDYEPDAATELPPEPAILRRSPNDSFPKPRATGDDLRRDTGHSAPFDDVEDEETDEESLAEPIESSRHRRQSQLPGPVPVLADPDESDLTFPGVNRQTSAEQSSRSHRVERLNAELAVRSFLLTRDARSGRNADVISAKSLKRGQKLVVQARLEGLKQIEKKGEPITRVTYHVEIRDAKSKVVSSTPKASSSEANKASDSSRLLLTWLTIPETLKPGAYALQVHVRDDLSKQTTVIDMPVKVQ